MKLRCPRQTPSMCPLSNIMATHLSCGRQRRILSGIMEKGIYYLLCVGVCFTCGIAQEMTIPVGVDGRDTLTVIRSQDTVGNYDVGYNENQLTGGASFHREKGYANGTREGTYGYTTRNGLIRIVTYVADQDGYRAQLLTNEPGIGSSSPSNVTVTKEKEPDPEALARGPTGSQSRQGVAASSSDVVKDYVSASAPEIGRRSYGSAQVVVTSPHGRYQYVV